MKWTRFSLLLSVIIFLAFVLRIYQVTQVPPGLYSDEISIGFNAYSILKTGKDEHGVFLPLWFKAFGEYKLPVYIYLTAASELILGKNDLAVRLPSVLAGVGSVVVFSFLLFSLTKSAKLALLGGLLLSISPWHLQFSRAAYEANLALFWVLLGTFFIIRWFNAKKIKFLFGAFFFVLSLYTYNVERIFVPLLFIGLLFLYRDKYRQILASRFNKIAFLFLLFLTVPFWRFAASSEGLIRAQSESFVQEVKITSDDFFRNLTFLQTHQYLKNYLSYYSFDFLFFSGDQIGRHSVREMGMTYLWQLPFFVIGLIASVKKRGRAEKIFFFWLFLAPLGAAFAKPNPHALRGLLMVVPFTFFAVIGILATVDYLYQQRLLTRVVLCGLFSYFFLLYLHIYYVHYPKRTASDWNSGYRQLVEYLNLKRGGYQKILLTEKLVPDDIYLLFYGDDLGGKYGFVKSPHVVGLADKTLYVSPFWEARKEILLKTISNLNGEELFKIWAN